MKRIVIAAVIVSFVTVGAFPASKLKSKKASAVPSSTSQISAPVPLSALFPAPAQQQETVAAGGMVTMDAPNHEVVMVRINDDGTRSHACVNTQAAARKFLNSSTTAAAPAKQEN
jgi:hypothetical protein